MMSTFTKPLRRAFIIICGALVPIAGIGPLAPTALAQTEPAPVQTQPEKPDPPSPRAGAPPTPPAAAPPLSPETKALRSKLDAFRLDLDQKEAALSRRDLSDAELQAM